MDFVELNIYVPEYVRADDGPIGYRTVPNPASYPHMVSPWLTIGPEALYWVTEIAARVWNLRKIYITENGALSDDVPNAKGEILDVDRVIYLRNCLTTFAGRRQRGLAHEGLLLVESAR